MEQNGKFINKPLTYRNLVYDMDSISNYWGKEFYKHMVLSTLDSHLEKDKIRFTTHTTHKNKLQINWRCEREIWNYKWSGDMDKFLYNLDVQKAFITITQMQI